MEITADEMVKMWESVRMMHPRVGYGVTDLDVPYTAHLDDGGYRVHLTFADVTYASTWHRMSTHEDTEPDLYGPVMFRDVQMIAPVRSFHESVRVVATLRREWIEWWISFNLRRATD